MYTNAGECSFGNDPLADDGALRNRRDAEFLQNNPSFSQIFENVIIGNGAFMETAILSFINITSFYLHDHAHPSHSAIWKDRQL